MPIKIRRETAQALIEYASIPIAFEVLEVIDLAALDPGRPSLPVRPVAPRIKDHDALPHNDPKSWLASRRVYDWIVLLANADGRAIAGAVVITDDSEVITLGGRPHNALLWDLRVTPQWRRRGVGRSLLSEAETIARQADAHALDVETQDTNVPACRLYASRGFTLVDVQRSGYGSLTDEAKLLWTKALR